MNNLRTRADSTAVDIALKNNTYSTLAAGLKDLDIALETDTGLLGYKNDTTYCRAAPRSTLTNNFIPKCKTDTTGELEDSIISQTSSSVIVNEDGGNFDFRVEGDTNANLLFCDASTDRIGIGTNGPADFLHIHNPSTSDSGECGINLGVTTEDSNTNPRARIYAIKNGTNAGQLRFQTMTSSSLTDKMTIDTNGNVGIGTVSQTARLELYVPKSSPQKLINFLVEDMAHGMTTIIPTNAAGSIYTLGDDGTFGTRGGLHILGIGMNDSCSSTCPPGITLTAFIGMADPNDTDPALKIIAGKKSSTSYTALANSETVLEIKNNTTSLITLLGDGTFKSLGEKALFGAATGYTYISNATVNFQYSENSDAAGYINWHGYLGGDTQFRDLYIGNGKGSRIVAIDGSTSRVGILTNDPSDSLDVASGYIKGAYKSSDGTVGVSGSGSTITCKDGIITAIS